MKHWIEHPYPTESMCLVSPFPCSPPSGREGPGGSEGTSASPLARGSGWTPA